MKAVTRNMLIGLGITVAAVSAWQIPKLLNALHKINIMPSGSYGFDWKGGLQGYGTFYQNIKFLNPTDTALNINLSGVKIFINNVETGYTKPQLYNFTIPAHGSYELKALQIIIPASSALSMVVDLMRGNFSAILNNIQLEVFGKVNGHSFDEKIQLSSQPQPQQPQPQLPQPQNTTFVGLGVTASTHRNIIKTNKLDYLFPKPDKNDIIIMQNGTVEDTVKHMIDIVKKYHKDTEKISKALVKDNLHDTLYNIWNFVYKYIQYKPDAQGVEQLRRPARTWADRYTGGDCDCMSIFISSILYNLNIPHKFRITKYDGKNYYQHVYVIVPTKNGKYITVDTVLDQFNGEKKFSAHKDFKVI